MSKLIERVKDVFTKGMIQNFEQDGYLAPIAFFIKGDTPHIIPIQSDMINSVEGKIELSNIMKKICSEPTVLVAGIVSEAYSAKIMDSSMVGIIERSDIRVHDLDNKEDIILLLISSPEGDDIVAYVVDIENKRVCERFDKVGLNQFGGLFSGFFNWNRN